MRVNALAAALDTAAWAVCAIFLASTVVLPSMFACNASSFVCMLHTTTGTTQSLKYTPTSTQSTQQLLIAASVIAAAL
jgi:hypothetical protein